MQEVRTKRSKYWKEKEGEGKEKVQREKKVNRPQVNTILSDKGRQTNTFQSIFGLL